ncbi:DNA-binding transcriptional LysR family regulator [Humibacillus xanthopallidus]|uniref:DNA-binding transcriptional LysR family regulator n=1 Tax=Humibacillus xanthopallidus TaxID=412689 RepID=A0A543PRM6_9MICO|nr:LysR family transcriptional regulator [Humibacillus xanthopallidus]TQN46728.1 DNA-binding transcriptional LysR family regulator [Humibacillus xanthopallidus]
MELDLRLVRYFVAVADELHFGRAAARLYVSQPALSKQIRKLEDQLGETLLVRDSRHVTLTARGQHFLEHARRLLALADTMSQPTRQEGVSIAHVFELSTSRLVADAFSRAEPDIELREHAMDSITQLNALMQGRLDVAILRVTPRMSIAHPSGWRHRLLRLEPLVLVGTDAGDGASTASFHERPLSVFADPPDSGSYNAHGQYLTALEQRVGLTMRWLGTPGAFSHCVAHVRRAPTSHRYLEFLSYAEKYVDVGLPMFWPTEIQPYYPWSLAWRSDDVAGTTTRLIEAAVGLADELGWLTLGGGAPHTPAWMPDDEPAWRDVAR